GGGGGAGDGGARGHAGERAAADHRRTGSRGRGPAPADAVSQRGAVVTDRPRRSPGQGHDAAPASKPAGGRLPDVGGATAVLPRLAAQRPQRRAARGLAPREGAGKASLAAGLVSQLERGLGNPAFLTIAKIASALDVPIGTFFEGPRTEGVVVRRHERKRLTPRDPDATMGPIYELLTPDVHRQLEV